MPLLARLFGTKQRLDPADQAKQERTWAELKAGRLPLSAQERLASQIDEHVFTSDLSTRDLVAVRAAGYEPVGQAFGTSTFTLSGQRSYYVNSFHPWQYSGGMGQPNVGPPTLINGFHDGEITCRRTALSRLQTECAALGGDGVIGVTVLRSSPVTGCYEFTVVGTAVRLSTVRTPSAARTPATAPSPGRVGPPFVTTLSAADFGALRRSGWRPVEVVFSLARYACHGGWGAGGGGGPFNPLNYRNIEIPGATHVVGAVREHVRAQLERQVKGLNSTGMILDDLKVALHHQHCVLQESMTDYYADADAIGTAIVRAPALTVHAERPKLDILPVIRLDHEQSAVLEVS